MQIHYKQNKLVYKEICSWLPPWLGEWDEILFTEKKVAANRKFNKILTVVRLGNPLCITVPNFVKIEQNVAEISRFL